MLLVNFRRVLESEALSRQELIGFLVALFIEEDGRLVDADTILAARSLLGQLTPIDYKTRSIWLEAMDRIDRIYKFPKI